MRKKYLIIFRESTSEKEADRFVELFKNHIDSNGKSILGTNLVERIVKL